MFLENTAGVFFDITKFKGILNQILHKHSFLER
jgi:hypothetical protein